MVTFKNNLQFKMVYKYLNLFLSLLFFIDTVVRDTFSHSYAFVFT